MEIFSSIVTIIVLIFLNRLIDFVQSGKVSFARVINNNADQNQCFKKNLLLQLPNESFTSSSVWKNGVEFEPYHARMIRMVDTNTNLGGQAWCPGQLIKSYPEEWIEIDLGDLKLIKNLFTMGRGDGNFEEFAPFFYFDYQRTLGKWYRYKNLENKEIFVGNSDSRNVARNHFESPIVARKIRIYPIGKDVPIRACMRIGLYGCDFDDGVVEYSVSQGHCCLSNSNGKYDLRDLTYDGINKTDNKTSEIRLESGLGQLMDNIIYHDTLYNDRNNKIQGYHFVGWNRKSSPSNKVEIVFKLDQIRKVKQIRLYTLNMIPNEIGVFASATIHFSIGGQIYDKISNEHHFNTVADRRVYHSRWIDIPLENIVTRFLKIDLIFDLEWIVLSEIVVISEKSDIFIPAEIDSIQIVSPKVQKSTRPPQLNIAYTVSVHSPNHKKETAVEIHRQPSFTTHSNLGLIATISSCFLGFVFLIALIVFGIIILRRRSKRSKGKLRYPIYQSRINGGPFIGDSVVVPLTGGTHSSSGTGSIYYKNTGSVELGLSYPVMGKEYMTLSSKSGTDYDMAGGNSLDGLIPAATRDSKFNSFGSHAPQLNQSESPYPNNIYSRNSVDGSTGGSSNTDYASTSLYHFSQVFENGSNFYTYGQPGTAINTFALQKLNPSVISSLNSSPFKVQSLTPPSQILPTSQIMDMMTPYSPYRQVTHHFSPVHSPSSRFLMPSNVDIYPSPYMVQGNNLHVDSPPIMINPMPPLQGASGNSFMIASDDTFHQQQSSMKIILSMLEEFHQEQIEHVSVIGKGEYGTIGFINITQNMPMEDIKNRIRSKTYLYKSLNNYKEKDVKYDTIREMELVCSVKNSAFLPLTGYVLDQQSSISIKQLTLCFLFEIDENLENLHSFLQQHAMNKAAVLNLPRGPTLYSQSISNISASPPFDTRHMYPSVASLLFVTAQIARGMSYLESQQIIHRDLAARNCLVGRNLTIKITDIAVSIQKFKEHYTECSVVDIQNGDDNDSNASMTVMKRLYPLQWMAFETILEATYSTKTDVWSFGVVMWEILNRCQQSPYGSYGINFDRIRDNAYHLSIGSPVAVFPSETLYLQQSQSTYKSTQNTTNYPVSILNNNLGLSREFSDLIRECWNKIPQQRPSFKNICLFFEQKINIYQFNLDQSPFINNSNNSETY